MKKYFFVLFLLINYSIFSSDLSNDIKNVSKNIDIILNDLYDLVINSNNEIIIERIKYTKEKVNNADLIFIVDNKLPADIFSGIGFMLSKDNKPAIGFNEAIFDIYKKNRSIVLSALIHEFQHAYDFYTNNRLYMIAINNELEKYFFEMDAYHIESIFINEILKKKNIGITRFESILSDSFTENNLDYFSLVFKGIDMKLIYYLTDYAGENNLDDTMKLYNNIGNDILTNFKEYDNTDDWIKYQSLIPSISYYIYIPQIALDVTYNKLKKDITPQNFDLKKEYPDIYDKWIKTKNIYIKYSDFYLSFRNQLYDKFNIK